MKNNVSIKISIIIILLIFISCGKKDEVVNEVNETNTWLPQTGEINGNLEVVSGLTAVKIWGAYHDMGYAYGYMLAENIVNLLNNALTDEELNISADEWNLLLENHLQRFNIPYEYTQELVGMLAGMEARTAENRVFIEELNRNLTLNDLKALNCDIARVACSSFSAWGSLTSDGGTITGRNMDFDRVPAFLNTQFVIIRIPNVTGKKGWISINWPGEIGCTTGMNEEGITVSQQDVNSSDPDIQSGYTPDNLIHRLFVENATIVSIEADISSILQANHSALGCAPMISWPNDNVSYAAIVPEFDGVTNDNGGFEIRIPEAGDEFIISANHFRLRHTPMQDCWRYNLLIDRMNNIKDGIDPLLTKNISIEILQQTPIPELVCMHSVVFEPNKGLIHIAFTDGINHAPESSYVTFNIDELFDLNW